MWVRGKLKWMEFSSNQESKSDGIIRRGIIEDITARKDRADESERSTWNQLNYSYRRIIHKKESFSTLMPRLTRFSVLTTHKI